MHSVHYKSMAVSRKRSRKPQRKGDKRARTRAALIRAAGEILREAGYEGASLETIAARAGMTRGAIYGNFKSRDELFAAVAFERWAPVLPRYQAGASFRQHMRRLGKAYAEAARERAPNAVHSAAFQLHMQKHPSLRKKFTQKSRLIRKDIATQLARLFPLEDLPMQPDKAIKILGALGEGLLIAYFIDPDEFPESLFVEAFEAMARK